MSIVQGFLGGVEALPARRKVTKDCHGALLGIRVSRTPPEGMEGTTGVTRVL